MTRFDDWAAHLDPNDEGGGSFLTDPVQEGLDRVGDALADDAVWQDPPPALRDRILAEAMFAATGADDAAPTDVAGHPPELVAPASADVVDVVDVGRGSAAAGVEPASAVGRARSRWFGVGLGAVAAAAVAVLALLAVPRVLGDSGGDITTLEAAGTELAPDAAARVDVETLGAGVAITLHITGLPPAGEGEYYAGWLTGPDGSVPIGSFHWREGGIPIELWSGVDVERYPRLGITLQQEGEPTTSSGRAVLTADLAGSTVTDD